MRLTTPHPPVLTCLFELLPGLAEHLRGDNIGVLGAHALLTTKVPMSQRDKLAAGLASLTVHTLEINCTVMAHMLCRTPLDTRLAQASLKGMVAAAGSEGGLHLPADALAALSAALDVEEQHPAYNLLNAVPQWGAVQHDALLEAPPPWLLQGGCPFNWGSHCDKQCCC
jgi:hypothetical protein